MPVTPPVIGAGKEHAMGWLILNPATRRGYQLFETTAWTTVIQSFDLDTLALRRRHVVGNAPLVIGPAVASANNAMGGEVVHAVDHQRGRIYLALGRPNGFPEASQASASGADQSRAFSRVLAIDEAAFDRGDAAFAAGLREPTSQLVLHNNALKSMAVDENSSDGNLVLLFADPRKTPAQDLGHYNHALTAWKWDRSAAPLTATATTATASEGQAVPATAAWPQPGSTIPGARVLESCNRNPIGFATPQFQWALLVSKGAIHLTCRIQAGTSHVVRVPLSADATRQPVGEEAPLRHRLGRSVTNVFADPSSGRLFLREDSNGTTWWVFDTKLGRFVGSFASLSGGGGAAYGIDPARGRLYALVPDHVYNRGSGLDSTGSSAVRGGLQYLDGYLDPVPALENTDPGQAYPGIFRIQVDPQSRRVFVRRGSNAWPNRSVYPSTATSVPSPVEPFYRVFQDDIPSTVPVPPQSDSVFTTNVEESPETTQASFLGEGGGFGSRVLLTGGLAAATTVGPESETGLAWDRSPVRGCAAVDRELVIGAATSASVSDVSTSGNAAALGADPSTKAELSQPFSRCLPSAWPGGTEPSLFQFDSDGDKADDYATECVGDQDVLNDTAGRDRGFRAQATCRDSQDGAEVTSSGAVGLAAAAGTVAAPVQVGVGSSSSTVTVQRAKEGGIQVITKSVARNVSIPLPDGTVAGIATVEAEARSWAGGRKETAGTKFTRVLCGAHLGDGRPSQCLKTPEEQRDFIANLNSALGANGEARLRTPDPALAQGSPSGYRSAVTRDRVEGFADRVINRDSSNAIPGLEVVFYRGDSPQRGAGRQIFQFAGVQAATTYGIACINGQAGNGKCAEGFGADDLGGLGDFGMLGEGGGTGELAGTTLDGSVDGSADAFLAESRGLAPSAGGALTGLLRSIARLPVDLARWILSSPGEFALMLTVWALIFWPCYLGERRRRLRGVAARRIASGVS